MLTFVLFFDFLEGVDFGRKFDSVHVQIFVLVGDIVLNTFGTISAGDVVEGASDSPDEAFFVFVLDIDARFAVFDRFGEFNPRGSIERIVPDNSDIQRD